MKRQLAVFYPDVERQSIGYNHQSPLRKSGLDETYFWLTFSHAEITCAYMLCSTPTFARIDDIIKKAVVTRLLPAKSISVAILLYRY